MADTFQEPLPPPKLGFWVRLGRAMAIFFGVVLLLVFADYLSIVTRITVVPETEIEVTGPAVQPGSVFMHDDFPAVSFHGIGHLGIVSGEVDEAGCAAPPIKPDDRAEPTVNALLKALKLHLAQSDRIDRVSHETILKLDTSEQEQLEKDPKNYSLQFGDGPVRQMSRATFDRCKTFNPKGSSPELAHVLQSLGYDAMLVVSEDLTSSPTYMNFMGGASPEADSSDKIKATLLLRDGSTAWSGSTYAEVQFRRGGAGVLALLLKLVPSEGAARRAAIDRMIPRMVKP